MSTRPGIGSLKSFTVKQFLRMVPFPQCTYWSSWWFGETRTLNMETSSHRKILMLWKYVVLLE